jgi:hypothetical protein
MDFEKPLKKVEGYLVYTTMLDFLETFVHEYTTENNGVYPSLRTTTDMLLNLLVDIRNLELSDLSSATIADALYEFETKLMKQAEKPGQEVFDSREVGLFVDEINTSWMVKDKTKPNQPMYPDEPLQPFKLTSKDDKDWLRKCGISPEEK